MIGHQSLDLARSDAPEGGKGEESRVQRTLKGQLLATCERRPEAGGGKKVEEGGRKTNTALPHPDERAKNIKLQ